MSLVKRAADFVYTIRFLTLLVTKFEDTEAFKAGIIDASGNKIKPFDMDVATNKAAYQSFYTPFHRLVFNIKKLLAKVPAGATTIASYAAALWLMKEHYGVGDKTLAKGLAKLGIDPSSFIVESNQWFVMEDNQLTPGRYRLKTAKTITPTFEELALPKDFVRVGASTYPVGHIFGVAIYEVVHIKTGKTIVVTVEDLQA